MRCANIFKYYLIIQRIFFSLASRRFASFHSNVKIVKGEKILVRFGAVYSAETPRIEMKIRIYGTYIQYFDRAKWEQIALFTKDLKKSDKRRENGLFIGISMFCPDDFEYNVLILWILILESNTKQTRRMFLFSNSASVSQWIDFHICFQCCAIDNKQNYITETYSAVESCWWNVYLHSSLARSCILSICGM